MSELYSKYYEETLKYATKVVGNAQDAEDIVQDTYVKVLTTKSNPDATKNIKGWLMVTLRNCIFDFFRRDKTYLNGDLPGEAFLSTSTPPVAENNLEYEYVLEKVSSIKDPATRKIVMRFGYEGFPYKEISQEVGFSEVACRNRFRKERYNLIEVFTLEKFVR